MIWPVAFLHFIPSATKAYYSFQHLKAQLLQTANFLKSIGFDIFKWNSDNRGLNKVKFYFPFNPIGTAPRCQTNSPVSTPS